jgi:hypothetical protein
LPDGVDDQLQDFHASPGVKTPVRDWDCRHDRPELFEMASIDIRKRLCFH